MFIQIIRPRPTGFCSNVETMQDSPIWNIWGRCPNAAVSFHFQGQKEMMQEFNIQRSKYLTLLKTDISPTKALLKRIFLFLRWDIFLVSWRVIAIFSPVVLVTVPRLGHFPTSNTHAMWSLAAAWSLGTRNALEADFGTHGSSPSLLRQVFFKVLVNCFTDDNDFLCLTPTQPTNIKTWALEGVFSYERMGFHPSCEQFFVWLPRCCFLRLPGCQDNKFMGELDEPMSSDELRELVLSESWCRFGRSCAQNL